MHNSNVNREESDKRPMFYKYDANLIHSTDTLIKTSIFINKAEHLYFIIKSNLIAAAIFIVL
jgi:hypothetical protein